MGFIYSSTPGGSAMPTIPGGYTIMEDSGIGEAIPGETGPTATVVFKILDAADRYSFANQMLGLWTGKSPSGVVQQAPAAYPPSPNLLCTAIPEIREFGKPKLLSIGLPWLYKAQALVTCVFTRPQWQAATNQGYFSIEFAGNGDFLTLPDTTYTFPGGTPATNVGAQVLGAEITVTRYRMPFLADFYMIQLAGLVNNAPFQIGNNTYLPGTLLFAPGNSSTQSDPLGNITYQMQYKFLYHNPPWNYFLNPKTSDWEIIVDGNNLPVYQSGNFDLLP